MINVTVSEQKTQSEFPKIMKSKVTGRIVLFISKLQGIQLNNVIIDGKETYMNYSQDWWIEDFTDYNEPITLQNA